MWLWNRLKYKMKKPHRFKVKSTNLHTVGYDFNRRKLEIRFRNGARYQYDNVDEMIYNGLLQAPSKGRYFWKYIRSNPEKFPYKRVV